MRAAPWALPWTRISSAKRFSCLNCPPRNWNDGRIYCKWKKFKTDCAPPRFYWLAFPTFFQPIFSVLWPHESISFATSWTMGIVTAVPYTTTIRTVLRVCHHSSVTGFRESPLNKENIRTVQHKATHQHNYYSTGYKHSTWTDTLLAESHCPQTTWTHLRGSLGVNSFGTYLVRPP